MHRRHTLLSTAASCALLLGTHASQAAPLWVQSDFRTSSSANASDFLPVGDFVLAAPAEVADFTVWLSDSSELFGGDGLADGNFTNFSGVLSWYFFADDGGLPGDLVASGTSATTAVSDTGVDRTDFDDDIFRVSGSIGPAQALAAGTWWFGFREGAPGQVQDASPILWLSHDGVSGAFTKLFLDGETPGMLNEAPNSDNAFVLRSVPEPASIALVSLGIAALALRRQPTTRLRPADLAS